jgi:primosomal protein DnaI
MDRIDQTIGKMVNSGGFQQRYEQMKQEIMSHPDVQAFLREHAGEITQTMLKNSMMKLYEYISQTKNCRNCPSLGECVNMMNGYEPELALRGNSIDLHYRKCHRKAIDDERKQLEKLIQSIYVPKDILEASFGDFALDTEGRLNAYEFAVNFASNYEPGKKMKGLYLYGNFGVGKSYLLGAIANQLAEKQIPSLVVYVPEFFREMKQSLGDHSLNEKLEKVKRAPVLMLDDIGAEAMSSWTRDEILGSIVQFRMQENLPTIFSSNFDYHELQHHLSYTQRGEEEKLKAARIMERIKYLTTPIRVEGPNRRTGM